MSGSAQRLEQPTLDPNGVHNSAAEHLFESGLCQRQTLSLYHREVRDRSDVRVLRCAASGVILLDGSEHIDIAHYKRQKDFAYWSARDRAAVLRHNLRDDQRRAEQFRQLFLGRRCLDVGTGAGGFLDQVQAAVASIAGVELQDGVRQVLNQAGHTVYPSLEAVDQAALDTVTLFHVLEHMTDPIRALIQVRRRLRPGGALVVEVPHARDFLLSHLNLEAFKDFTFWSEHLVLHTRQSLERTLKLAGFHDIAIKGYQRYPLSNHLFWLREGKPGGHERHPELSEPGLERSYADLLGRLDATDTLIATACA